MCNEGSSDIAEKKILEAQLFHAQQLAELGALTGSVAHDFNNILTAIMGYGSLLRKNLSIGDLRRGYCDQIVDAAQRGARLTGTILAFARKKTMNQVHVSLNEIVRRVENFLKPVIGEGIEFKIKLSTRDAVILADPVHIEQVLLNLATNARDAMPCGGLITIGTEIVQGDREGAYVCLTVSDEGTGMNEKTMERIFNPFFTTKEAGKGTGLGLATVHRIVKQHSGHINCYSEPGRGTTFKIYLPALNEKIEGDKKVDQPDLPYGSETVLIAEDDTPVRQALEGLLRINGYTVFCAVHGEDAVKTFSENRNKIQLVILDVAMPKKSGRDAESEITKIKPDVKTLLMSGYAEDMVQNAAFNPGLNFISKPILPEDFLKKIRELLDAGSDKP